MFFKFIERYSNNMFKKEEDRRKARILWFIIVANCLSSLVMLVLDQVWGDKNLTQFIILNFFLQAISLFFFLRKNLIACSYTIIGIYTALTTLFATTGEGIHDYVIMVYPIIIIFAGLTQQRRGLFLSVILSLIAIAWLIFGDSFHWYVKRPFHTPNWTDLVAAALILFIAAMAVYFLITTVEFGAHQIRRELTERQRTEQALKNSQSQLRALTNSTQQSFILMDKNGEILSFNRVAAQNTSAVLGLEIQEGDSIFKFLRENERKAFKINFKKTLRGKTIRDEQLVNTIDGQQHWFALTYNPSYADDGSICGICLNATDITESKRIEKELNESHEDFQRYFNMNAVGLAVSAPSKNWIEVNDRLCQMLGYSEDELKKLSWVEITHPDDLEINLHFFNRTLSGEIDSYELDKRFIRKDGGTVYTSTYVACVRNPDRSLRYSLVSIMDITERKLNERLLEEANEQLQSQVEEIELLQAELREQAIRDPLTGLYNRRYLSETIERDLARMKREKKPLSMIMMDIDHFKLINDSYGHQTGDLFLSQISLEIASRARSSDIACRYGGEELLLVLSGATPQDAFARAEEIRQACAEIYVMYRNKKLGLTLSMGIATYPMHGKTADEILSKADQAMYLSKQAGRNRSTIWSESEN